MILGEHFMRAQGALVVIGAAVETTGLEQWLWSIKGSRDREWNWKFSSAHSTVARAHFMERSQKYTNYKVDLNDGLFGYSEHRHVSNCQMVCFSNTVGIWNPTIFSYGKLVNLVTCTYRWRKKSQKVLTKLGIQIIFRG